MTQKEAHFEGQTDGVTVSIANSDDFGDNIWDAFANTNMVSSYSTAQAMHGTVGLKFTGGTAASSSAIHRWTWTSASQMAIQFYFRMTALPSAQVHIVSLADSGGAGLGSVGINTDGKVGLTTPTGTLVNSTGTLAINTWYRIDFLTSIAVSGGLSQVNVYTGDGATLVQSAGGSGNTGSTLIGRTDFGKSNGSPSFDVFYLDDIRAKDGTSTAFAAYSPAANQPPVVTAPAAVDGTVGSPLSITGTATDADGTIATRAWTCTSFPGSAPTLSGASTATVTFTPATAGVYTFSFTATDNSGASPASPAVTQVYVPASTVTVNAEPENSAGWSGSYTDLADASDTTYVQTTGSGTGTDTFTFNPTTASAAVTIKVRAAYVDAGAVINCALVQGTTTIASWTITPSSTTPTDYPQTLTGPQAASITDWRALKIVFS